MSWAHSLLELRVSCVSEISSISKVWMVSRYLMSWAHSLLELRVSCVSEISSVSQSGWSQGT